MALTNLEGKREIREVWGPAWGRSGGPRPQATLLHSTSHRYSVEALQNEVVGVICLQ